MLWVNSVISVEIQEKLINTYPSVVEKLVYFKRDKFKAFYGGPIDKKGNGVKWIMPVAFEDELNRTRAIYEIAFINCTPHTAQDAEILFIDVPEINIKLKNNLTPDYIVFSSLLNGNYKNGKYVVVRFAEIANVYYPDIFVFSLYGNKLGSDKDEITRYLHEFFHTQRCFLDYYKSPIIEKIFHDSDDQMLYEPIFVQTKFDQQLFSFYVVKAIRKKDIWKVYYLIYRADTTLESLSLVNEPVLVRLDSGCISGQVYDDEACDCLDQLHDGLHQLIQDVHPGIIIHIPTHDGRGFGTAPKAETEIYKRGGKGRIHSTVSLDTVAAAKLLYGVDNYDFRSFDGATQILVSLGIKKVILLTDNLEKVATLQKYGIEVLRKKTETNKASCIMHIEAKKNSSLYFSE
jgi:GTP cyclohydrolase II